MSWQTTLYFGSILLTCGLTGFLAWYAWRQPHVTGARSYAYMVLAESLLALTEIGVMLVGTQAQALFWFSLRVPFAAVIPVFWLFFALDYSGRSDWLSKPMRAALFAIPIITQVVMVTSSLHGLWLVRDVAFEKIGPFWIADTSARIPGFWYLVHTFYSTLLLVVGAGVLMVAAWRKPKLLGQALLVSLGALTALGLALSGVFNLLPGLRFNPFVPGIGFSAVCYALAIFRFQFLKLAPSQGSGPRLTDLKPEEKGSLAVLVLIFILFVSGITAASYLTYRNYERQFRAQVEAQLSAIAELKAGGLVNWRAERMADAKTIHENSAFTALAQKVLEASGDAQAEAQLLDWLDSIRNSYHYDRIFLLDTDGVERVSSPAAPDGVPDSLLEQAAAASMESDQIIFMDFHRHPDKENIHLSMLVPIHFSQDGRSLGVLVIWIDPYAYLYPFIQQWPVPGTSAETILIRREGEDAVYLNSLRFQQDAALNLRFPLDETQLPAVKAVLGETGIVEGVDYRGEKVIADIRAIPDSPWFLVSKMDAAEVYAPLRERLWQIILFFTVLTLACGVGLALFWRQQQIRHFRSRITTLDALRESEEKFRLAFDTSPDSVAITRLSDGMFVSVNKGFELITGYTREQVIGKTSTEINIWKDPQDRRNVVDELKVTGEVRNYEASFLSQGGEIYGLMSAVVIELNGEPHILNITRDITARKQAEAELQTAFQRFQIILSSLYGGILVVNNDGWVEFANQSFCELFDLEHGPESLIGLKAPEVIRRIANVYADPPQALARIQELVDRNQPLQDEEIAIAGGKTYIRDFIPIVIDGKQYGRLWHHLDITERKRVEERLRESETNLSALIENTDGSIWAVDQQYGLIVGNRELHHNTSVVLGHRLEMGESVLLPGFPAEVNAEWQGYYDRALQGEHFTVEMATRFRDVPHYIEYRFSPIHENGGEIRGVTIFGRDVTERKLAEEALKETERAKTELLEKLNEAQHFASIGSWEWDLPGGRVWWSDETYRIFGVTQQEFTPDFETNRQFVHPDDIEKYSQVFERSIQTGEPLAMDIRLVTGDGRLKHCDVKGTIICDDAGQPLRFIGTIMDITQRRLAEDALDESNQRFKALLSQAPFAGVIYRFIYDAVGNIADWEISDINPLGAASIGLTVETAIGKRALDIFGAEVMAPYFEIARQVGASGQPRTFETYFEANDRYYLSSVFMVDSVHYANMSVDITSRKRTEQALYESENKYRTLIENMQVGMVAHRPDTSILLSNAMASQLLGLTSDQMLGKTAIDPAWHFVHENGTTIPLDEYPVNRALAANQPIRNLVLGIIHPDREFPTWVQCDAYRVQDLKGNVQQVIVTFFDISERKRAEDALRESEAFVTTVLDNLPVGIAVNTVEPAVTFNYMNDNFARFYRTTREKLSDPDIFWNAVYEDADFRESIKKKILDDLASGDPERMVWVDVPITRKGELTSFITARNIPIPGKPLMISTIWDVTERKQAQEQLLKTLDELKRSNTELEQFAYVASHDLQEPLRAVAGMVQLLQQRYKDRLDERADEYISLAVEGATRMQTLINDLLAYSRVERRGSPIKSTDAHAALQSALRNLGAAILESGAVVTNGSLPTLEADATQLAQLFQNLIGNAIKFRGQDTPNIHVEARDLGEAWQFSVSDNGIGIEPQYYERIFLVFQRLHTRRDYPGTGIGLSICKKIVERHGGRIWIESTPGQGTTFHFTIPHRR